MAQTPPQLPQELCFRAYEPFPLLPDLDLIVRDWTDEQIQAWWDAAGKSTKQHEETRRHNQEVEAHWAAIFEANGRPAHGVRGGTKEWFREALFGLGKPTHTPGHREDAYYYRTVTVAGKPIRATHVVNWSPCTLKDIIHTVRRHNHQEQAQEKAKADLEAKLLALAPEVGITSADYSTVQDFLKAVADTVQERWVTNQYPDGTVLPFDSCDCDSWTVGASRCECGNRRAYLNVEGDVLSGFHAYPMAD